MELTKEQRDILDHTVHRTARGFYVGDSDDMQELVKKGFMYSAGKTSFCPDEYFRITSLGRKALNEETLK